MMTETSPKAALLTAFRDALQRIDYPAGQIQEDYGYSDFLGDGQRQTVDLAAFGNAVPSLRTCNIGVMIEKEVTAQRLVRLRALGAPLLFSYDFQRAQVSRWRMTRGGLPEQLDSPRDVSPDRLPDYFHDHRGEWNPEAFRQARAATFRQEASQLDFFDRGLLPALEGELQNKLSRQIQNIAARSREILNEREGDGAFEQRFSDYAQLLFRLLAARLLSDRGDLSGMTQTSDVDSVLRQIDSKYHASEPLVPALSDSIVQNQVWKALQNGLDLRNLSPETLAFVYENTLVDPDLRRRNGIYATPPHVADYLLRQLPIERLPEAERIVFEPFCGNAPFLLAAMRRLRELLRPADRTPQEVHAYLAERLLGLEVLPFAREIARYSLILGDYPNDNSWQVAEADAFTNEQFDLYLQRANIVLSNPPHEAFDPGERPAGAHHNKAAEALRRVLLNPPDLLGFVMPLSFAHGSGYRNLRRQIVDAYPSINMTAMPDSVFGNASQPTMLIAAHRLDTQKRYFWAEVSAQDYGTTFAITGSPSLAEQKTALPASEKGEPILWQRPQGKIASFWDFLVNYPRLSGRAELHRGLEWAGDDGRYSTKGAIIEEEREGFEPGLHRVSDDVEAYFVQKTNNLDVRPERARRNALKWSWELPKVLIGEAPMSRTLWRLLVMDASEGMYASSNYIGVWPRNEQHGSNPVLSVEALGAILNGPLANAFVYYHGGGKRHNYTQVIGKIFLPNLTDAQVGKITALVDAYKDLRWENIDEPTPWTGVLAERGRRALLKIDAAVLEAYALPPDLEADLLRQFDGVERRHLPFAFNGYDREEWATANAELADDRDARRIADEFFTLLRKRNLGELTPAEQKEYNRLQSLREARQGQYRTLIAPGK